MLPLSEIAIDESLKPIFLLVVETHYVDNYIFQTVLQLQNRMTSQVVELIPISEGNRITVKTDEKLIIGRGSSLGVGFLFSYCGSFIK